MSISRFAFVEGISVVYFLAKNIPAAQSGFISANYLDGRRGDMISSSLLRSCLGMLFITVRYREEDFTQQDFFSNGPKELHFAASTSSTSIATEYLVTYRIAWQSCTIIAPPFCDILAPGISNSAMQVTVPIRRHAHDGVNGQIGTICVTDLFRGLAPFPFSPPQPATSGAGYCSRNYRRAPSITIRLRGKLTDMGMNS